MSIEKAKIKLPSAFSEAVKDRFYPPNAEPLGFPMPWEKLKHCRIRPAELSIWTGINGHGKSMALSQALALGGALRNKKSLICSFEMKPEKTLFRLVRQVTGLKLPDMTKISQAISWLDSHVTLYDVIGRGSVSKMLIDFEQAVIDGIEIIIIDSLMCLGIKEDDHTAQKDSVHALQLFAQQHNIHIALVAHSRKGSSESDKPGKLDVLGSSHITNLADTVWSIWRNKPKEGKVNACRAEKKQVPEELMLQYDAVFECSKSREGDDEERMYGMYYDPASSQFRDEFYNTIAPLNEEMPF